MPEHKVNCSYTYLSILLYIIFKHLGRALVFLSIITILFFIIYPTWFVFLPIPSDRIIQLVGVVCFFAYVLLRKKILLDQRFLLFIGVAFLIVFISWLALLWSPKPNLYLVKRLLNILFYSFSFYFVISYVNQFKPNLSLGRFLDYIIYVVLLQAVVSLFLFLNPNLYESFISIIRPEVNEGLLERVHLIQIRLLGISNSFFTASTNYGIHFLLLMLLPYCRGSLIYKNKLWYYTIVAIIAIAGILSGRTVFIAIALGGLYILTVERNRVLPLLSKSFKILALFVLSFIAAYFIFRDIIDFDRVEKTISWVFEMFIQYSEGGQIETNTTDVMLRMYIWPEELSTWIYGDGLILNGDGSYYMHTDIGYIRLLYYFGLIGIFSFITAQFSYCIIAASYYKNSAIKIFLFFLFLWILILNLKGLSDGDFYFSFFIVYGSIQYRNYKLYYSGDDKTGGAIGLPEDIKIKRKLKW